MEPVTQHSCATDGLSRRNFLHASACVAAACSLPSLALAQITEAQRSQLTSQDIIEHMKRGNQRFREGKPNPHDYVSQKQGTASGQYPAAAIVGCIDSRAPAEILFDARIGDAFNARIAGNIVNADILGSLEFACALAGAKLILVLGHTACGAVKGAIDNAKLGHLTGLLEQIKPAVAATAYDGERTSKNSDFVDKVAATNVRLTVRRIRDQSAVLADLERQGKLLIAGAMYQLSGGRVEFLT